jgi:lysophospholipase L1-like esterase
MIIFLGDSFTWGQGLQIPYWLKNGKTIEECQELMPPKYPAELYDFHADEYRKKHHFPNLVAKHFNKSYCTKWGNGGANSQIHFLMEESGRLMDTRGIDVFIIQFTEATRDKDLIDEFYKKQNYLMNNDNFPNDYIQYMIKNFDERFKCIYPNKKWFGFSWHSDIGKLLETEYKENFIPIILNGKEYNNFEDIRTHYRLDLASTTSVTDGHFNEDGHKVIADSIIKKITPYL